MNNNDKKLHYQNFAGLFLKIELSTNNFQIKLEESIFVTFIFYLLKFCKTNYEAAKNTINITLSSWIKTS